MLCRKCGNTGTTRDNPYKCDACGLESTKIEKIYSTPLSDKPNINIEQIIPIRYRDINFSKSKLLSTGFRGKSVENHNKFKKYCNTLGVVYDIVRTGNTPKSSLFISSGSGYAKRIFAYSLIKEAIKNNLSIMPILDLRDIHALLWHLDIKDIDKYLHGVTEYDIFTVDICIISIERVNLKYTSVLQYILDKRSKLNKATIVLSNLSKAIIINKNPELYSYFNTKVERHTKGDTQYLLTVEYSNDTADYTSSDTFAYMRN